MSLRKRTRSAYYQEVMLPDTGFQRAYSHIYFVKNIAIDCQKIKSNKSVMINSKDVFRKHKKDSLITNHRKVLPNKEFIAHGNWYKGDCTTFQECMKVILIVGQCFGLNPVLGICGDDPSKLRFTFLSGRCLYSLLSILCQALFVIFLVAKFAKDTNSSIDDSTSMVFYTSNCLTAILFLRVSIKWPRLSKYISRSEASDPAVDTGLKKRCNTYCFVMILLAIVEHVLSDLAGLAYAMNCSQGRNLYEVFIVNSFPWIYDFIEFNHFNGVVSQFVDIQCTLNWNYVDLFVICVSMYLTSRFEQVNRRIISVSGKYVPPYFWRTMREDYSRITLLVRKVDDVIGGLVFISFANNLFFICLQLLHILAEGLKAAPSCRVNDDVRPLRGSEQPLYLAFSLVFLVGRSLTVSLLASDVHTASRRPVNALYQVSSDVYCVEIQRFLDQIHGETVALTGLQFFNVKRGLVLTIAGTIVTYELVLMQFTGVTPTTPPPT